MIVILPLLYLVCRHPETSSGKFVKYHFAGKTASLQEKYFVNQSFWSRRNTARTVQK